MVNVSWDDAVALLPLAERGDASVHSGCLRRRSGRRPHGAATGASIRGAIRPRTRSGATSAMKVGDTTPVGNVPGRRQPVRRRWIWPAMSGSGRAAPTNPILTQPNDGREDPGSRAARVLRGGSFDDDARGVRCASRSGTIRTSGTGTTVFGLWRLPSSDTLDSESSGLWPLGDLLPEGAKLPESARL